jgi:hypothetical protein
MITSTNKENQRNYTITHHKFFFKTLIHNYLYREIKRKSMKKETLKTEKREMRGVEKNDLKSFLGLVPSVGRERERERDEFQREAFERGEREREKVRK